MLLDGSGTPETLERLRILEKSTDGFVLAEEDLRLRGAGDILGTAQSGMPPLQIADLYRDADLLSIASSEAARILREDPALAESHHAPLCKLRAAYAGQLATISG